jgi:hypothetical protein
MSRALSLCVKTLEFPFRSACVTALAAFILSFAIIRVSDWLPLTWFDWLEERLPGIKYAVEPVIYSRCDPKIAAGILVGLSVTFIFGLLFCLAVLIGAPSYHDLLRHRPRSRVGKLAHRGLTSLHIWRGSVLSLFAIALVKHFWLSRGSHDLHDQLICASLHPDYVQLMVSVFFSFLADYFIATAVKDLISLTSDMRSAPHQY